VHVSLLYVDDCPNRQLAEGRLAEALGRVGKPDQHVEHRVIATDEEAQAARFRGSPTILVDGEDPFEGDDTGPFGLSCRVYRSETGLAGSPTVDELVAVLRARA
jgi:hypothetical protein